ncbi:hypothetical protein ACPPVW_14630 [Leifsonia sp. McL0607]|uniref:hypothetical protein n=1 Tax=Leifsonia sp. McL0607 TaxID=3415672 RepID=UPI003CEFB80A
MSTGPAPVPTSSSVIRGAHLVGSIDLPDTAVLRTASDHLGDRLPRIPDGEFGERSCLHAAVSEA